jgi:peptide/nickel transport system substrate-binding protein
MDNVQGKDVAGVKSDPNLVYVDTEEQGVSRRMPFDGRNPESPFVKHVDLRKALHYAIDRQTLGKTLGFELAADARYMFGKGSFAYDESAPFYAYDKAKAEQLVKGVLAKDPSIAGPDGKINANISVISRVVDRQQAEIIKQMASVVGIELKIEILERAAFVAKLVQLPGKAGADYHVSTVQNPLTPVDPDNTLRAVYHSRGGQNYPHIGPFDELIDKAAATYDVEERKKVYRELAMKDYELGLMVYMWFQKYNWLQNKKVKNVSEHIWGAPYFDDVWLE